MCVSLFWAMCLGGEGKPKDVQVILGLLMISLTLVGFLGGSLWVTITCYALTNEYNKEMMQTRYPNLQSDSVNSNKIADDESAWDGNDGNAAYFLCDI